MRIHALLLATAAGAALSSAAATGTGLPEAGGGNLVEVREEALPVRPRRDRWSGVGNGGGATASWDDVGVAVALRRGRGAIRPDHWTPQSPMLPRVEALVVKTDGIEPGDAARISVSLKENSFGSGREKRAFTADAPWRGGETRVPFDLPEDADGWTVESIAFNTGGGADASFHFLGVDAVTRETPAAALRLDVETGNPMRLVRPERGERPALALRNPTGAPRRWTGEVVAEDFFGAAATSRLDIALAPGETARRDFAFPTTRGIMFVRARVECEGAEAVREARFAVVEAQESTPPQPAGEFRLGVNWHVTRYTPADRAITTAAAVAIGAKIMRGNFATFGTCEPREGEFNWADTDRLVDSLETNGIAIDAILTGFPQWAQGEDGALRPGALRDYAAALAARYGTRIAWYEFGNEWDLKRSSLPGTLRLMRELHEGVKSACPAAKVIPPGFAAESSVRHPASKVRPGFQEGLMTEGQPYCDAHPVHIHSLYREFAGKVDFLLRWRRERGVTVPWYANETAVSVVRLGERVAAETVWRKILHAWSRGSVDYIWYNLRGTGWHPRDPEQDYGLFTADYRPRATAAAFAALSGNFRHLAADGVLRDGRRRQVLRFAGEHGGRRLVALAGWDELAQGPMPIRVATDATEAWMIDLMGNRRPVALENGAATWKIGASPSALFLADATFVKPDAADLSADAPEPVTRIAPGPDFGKAPDLVLRDSEQVFDLWEAVPDKAERTWKWWGDLLANVFFGPGDEIPFNVRVYENDGEGPDGWIEWRPLDEPPPARIAAQPRQERTMKGILELNPPETVLPVLQNMRMRAIKPVKGAPPEPQEEQLVLLHFSDIHNDVENLRRVMEFARHYAPYLDDVLLTGDIAGGDWSEWSDAMDAVPGFHRVLKTLGNHDIYRWNGTPRKATAAESYDRYFKGIETWGVVQPDGDNPERRCYWYKDYPKCRVRLIALDSEHRDEAQREWFLDVLADARERNLAVLGAHHIPPAEPENIADSLGALSTATSGRVLETTWAGPRRPWTNSSKAAANSFAGSAATPTAISAARSPGAGSSSSPWARRRTLNFGAT